MTDASTGPAFAYGWGSAGSLVALVRPTVPTAAELADRHAIEQTVRTYGWAIDENRFDVFAELLGPDVEFSGVIAGVAPLDTVAGRETLTQWLREYMATRTDQLRHSLGNVIVTELADGRATALAYLTLHSTTAEATTPLASAFYRFTLFRQDDGWFVDTVFAGFDKPF